MLIARAFLESATVRHENGKAAELQSFDLKQFKSSVRRKDDGKHENSRLVRAVVKLTRLSNVEIVKWTTMENHAPEAIDATKIKDIKSNDDRLRNSEQTNFVKDPTIEMRKTSPKKKKTS